MSTKEDCEKAIERSESLHQKDPSNPRILTRWGIMLLSLSGFHRADADEMNKLLQDAILKLEEALNLDPNDHEALTWLGRTYTTKGLHTSDHDAANVCFDKAEEYCGKAYDLQPQNITYRIYLKDVPEARKIQPLINKRDPATTAPGQKNLLQFLPHQVHSHHH